MDIDRVASLCRKPSFLEFDSSLCLQIRVEEM